MQPWATCCSKPCFEQEVGPDYLQTSLPTLAIWWSWNSGAGVAALESFPISLTDIICMDGWSSTKKSTTGVIKPAPKQEINCHLSFPYLNLTWPRRLLIFACFNAYRDRRALISSAIGNLFEQWLGESKINVLKWHQVYLISINTWWVFWNTDALSNQLNNSMVALLTFETLKLNS